LGANLKCELRTRIFGLCVGLFRVTAPGIVFAKEGPVKFMYSLISSSINSLFVTFSSDAKRLRLSWQCQPFLCL